MIMASPSEFLKQMQNLRLDKLQSDVRKNAEPEMIERFMKGAGLSRADAEVCAHIAFGVLGFK